jgi:hypothetical protein
MSQQSLEQRVAALERTVARLEGRNGDGTGRTKDWRRTIGMFTDDPGALAIFEEAQKLRRKNRAGTQPRGNGRRARKNGTAKSARAKR